MPLPSPHEGFPANDPVEAGPREGGAPADEAALDAAVRATIAAFNADDRALVQEQAALQAVVHRLGPRPFDLDQVAVGLVEAMVNVNYGHLHRTAEFWQAIAAKIASVLVESPTSRTRLENLWRQLIELHGSDA
jgi:hypothetical protein